MPELLQTQLWPEIIIADTFFRRFWLPAKGMPLLFSAHLSSLFVHLILPVNLPVLFSGLYKLFELAVIGKVNPCPILEFFVSSETLTVLLLNPVPKESLK